VPPNFAKVPLIWRKSLFGEVFDLTDDVLILALGLEVDAETVPREFQNLQ